MKIDRKLIMKGAWDIYEETHSKPFLFPLSFAECLKEAWEYWRTYIREK